MMDLFLHVLGGPTTSVVAETATMAIIVVATAKKKVLSLVVGLEACFSWEKISDALKLPCAVVADTP